MENKLNKLNEEQTLKSSVRNFTELNFKEVNIWKNKIAWSFFKVDINEEYNQLLSREYPSSFLIRTESGNIYKIFKPNYWELFLMTGDDLICQEVLSWPIDRCIFNPKTGKIAGVENSIIRCGEEFAYAPKCNTSKVNEIVGISDSQGSGDKKISFTSMIEEEYKQQKK